MSHGATAAHVHQAPTGFIRKYIFSMDHKVIGMVNLLFTVSTALGERVAMLEDMVVAPAARGTGVGSALLQHAIAFAQQQGARRPADRGRADGPSATRECRATSRRPRRKDHRPVPRSTT